MINRETACKFLGKLFGIYDRFRLLSNLSFRQSI